MLPHGSRIAVAVRSRLCALVGCTLADGVATVYVMSIKINISININTKEKYIYLFVCLYLFIYVYIYIYISLMVRGLTHSRAMQSPNMPRKMGSRRAHARLPPSKALECRSFDVPAAQQCDLMSCTRM